MTSKPLLFLSWGSPWPAQGGGTLRTFALLKQLSKAFPIDLVVLSNGSLSRQQEEELKKYAQSITVVPIAGKTIADKFSLVTKYIITHQLPYHCALLHLTFSREPEILRKIHSFPGIVYASYGQWGTLAEEESNNWILDQHNADIQFWRVYASQTNTFFAKVAALINWQLAKQHFPKVYSRISRIVSVCNEDQKLTMRVSPNSNIDVIENGVDCSYYQPIRQRSAKPLPLRLLFTGTSAPRNLTALHQFTKNIFPLVRSKITDCELLVAGNFSLKAQLQFKNIKGLHFTGRVENILPYFNESDIYISPFEETHGSKLKISEAMAMAIPIVSTSDGIRGFELVDGDSVLMAKNNAEFAEKIIKLAHNKALREKLGRNARKIALSTVDWNMLGEKLVSIIEDHFKKLGRC